MIDKDKVRNSFNKASDVYDNYAKIQVKMADYILNLINIGSVNNILEIGCGTGILTRKLLTKYPSSNITVLDIAENMLEKTKQNLESDGFNLKNIKFICEDAELVKLDCKYDLIISNATIQWFNDFNKSIQKYVNLLNKNGQIVLSTFGEKNFIELERISLLLSKNLSLQEKPKLRKVFISKNEILKILEKLNINYFVNDMLEKEYFNNSFEFFKSVKKIGASISSNVLNPVILKTSINFYNKEFIEHEKIYATYHLLYISIKE